MTKLPRPHRPLPDLREQDVARTEAGTRLWRVYAQGGPHPGSWNGFRTYGPIMTMRFDPQAPPPGASDRGVMYVAFDIPTTIAETFQATRTINRFRRAPWLAAFDLARDLQLLDLTSGWPTRAGASQAISSGRRDHARMYSVAAYEEYGDVDGMLYHSSMLGRLRAPGGTALSDGRCAALFDRAWDAIPPTPTIHLPLGHPGLAVPLDRVADAIGYRFPEVRKPAAG
jgi:RES domain-containing protein